MQKYAKPTAIKINQITKILSSKSNFTLVTSKGRMLTFKRKQIEEATQDIATNIKCYLAKEIKSPTNVKYKLNFTGKKAIK